MVEGKTLSETLSNPSIPVAVDKVRDEDSDKGLRFFGFLDKLWLGVADIVNRLAQILKSNVALLRPCQWAWC